jgi:hypothetical protein
LQKHVYRKLRGHNSYVETFSLRQKAIFLFVADASIFGADNLASFTLC